LTEILLKELKNKGITIKVISNGKLWLGPKSKLTPKLIERARKHKAEIIKALQCKPQPKRDEVCTAFEMLDKVWRNVLKGKEDIASFKRALEEWEIILLSNLKEFV